MNYLFQEDQVKVNIVKKDEADRKKAASRLAASNTPMNATAPLAPEAARAISPHLLNNPILAAALAKSTGHTPNGAEESSEPVKKAEPKVQLIEAEEGVYDIHFTCGCGEQYVIRCESLEKSSVKKA